MRFTFKTAYFSAPHLKYNVFDIERKKKTDQMR